MKRGRPKRRLGVRHRVPERVERPGHLPPAQTPLREAIQLVGRVNEWSRNPTAAEVARRELGGRHRSVASILLRAGRLARDAQGDPALKLKNTEVDSPVATWAWLQRTVRKNSTPKSFTEALRAAIEAQRDGNVIGGGSAFTIDAGQAVTSFVYDQRDLDGQPEHLVATFERWVALRIQDFVATLRRRQPGRSGTAYAAANAGAGLERLSQLTAGAARGASPAPPSPQTRAIARLTAFGEVVAEHRRPSLPQPPDDPLDA
jgi:hypothetical protein